MKSGVDEPVSDSARLGMTSIWPCHDSLPVKIANGGKVNPVFGLIDTTFHPVPFITYAFIV